MTRVQSIKFTPELLITAPRRSAVVPNASGTHGLFRLSTYDLEAHKEIKETRIFNIEDASSTLFTSDDGDSDAQWLGDTDLVLYQRSTKSEETELWIGNAIGEKKAYYAGKIASSVLDLKVTQLKNGDIGISFCSPTNPKGKIFNPKSSDKPKHTGKDVTSHPVRIWTEFKDDFRYSLYYSTISKQASGRWKLNENKPINALKGTKLQFPLCTGAVLGETGSYTIGPHGILVCLIEPGQNTALALVFRPYFIRLNDFQESKPKVVLLKTKEYIGAAGEPCFSADGSLGAFVVARTENFLSSERGLAWFHTDDNEIGRGQEAFVNLYKFYDGKKPIWDRIPSALIWSHDNKALYMGTDDLGFNNLFKLDIDTSELTAGVVTKIIESAPKQLTKEMAVSGMYLLERDNTSNAGLLITSSSFVEPSLYSILNGVSGKIMPISSISNEGKELGLSETQFESITFPGDQSEIQAHIVRPSFFDPSKKYPVALLVHGGPQAQWTNSWSTRWNAAIWAEQGYIALLPNPAGSTGGGLELMSSVSGDWGGRCYRDIVKAVDYLEENYEYADTERMVMGGGSFGGYMACWIAGQPLGKRVKAIVCHSGIFHDASMLASDFTASLGDEVGSPLGDPSAWEKWSPFTYIKNWSAPMLVVHGALDYRCPINEGLAAYATCQSLGIESRFLYYPDEGHWVLKRENSLMWMRTVLGWFNHYAGVTGGIKLEPANCDAVFDEDSDDDDSDDDDKDGKERSADKKVTK